MNRIGGHGAISIRGIAADRSDRVVVAQFDYDVAMSLIGVVRLSKIVSAFDFAPLANKVTQLRLMLGQPEPPVIGATVPLSRAPIAC